jgi:hypothetical protein
MRIIRGLRLTAAVTPLCIEIIMAKDRNIIITIMIGIRVTFLIATDIGNSASRLVGARIIQNTGISIGKRETTREAMR